MFRGLFTRSNAVLELLCLSVNSCRCCGVPMPEHGLGRMQRGIGGRFVTVARGLRRITWAPDRPIPVVAPGQSLCGQAIARAITSSGDGRKKRFILFAPSRTHVGSREMANALYPRCVTGA